PMQLMHRVLFVFDCICVEAAMLGIPFQKTLSL
ncbi:MAG: hypothetical protein ACI8YB_002397, partial [Patiriisocius sp.]